MFDTTPATGFRRRFERDGLQVVLEQDEVDRLVATATGVADTSTAGALAEAFAAVRALGRRELVIDADGLTFLDSSGIRTLLLGRELLGSDALVTLRSPHPAVRRIVEELALDEVFHLEA